MNYYNQKSYYNVRQSVFGGSFFEIRRYWEKKTFIEVIDDSKQTRSALSTSPRHLTNKETGVDLCRKMIGEQRPLILETYSSTRILHWPYAVGNTILLTNHLGDAQKTAQRIAESGLRSELPKIVEN